MSQLTKRMCYSILLLFIAICTYSQPSSIIEGVVADNNGKPLTGVLVKLKGSTLSATTDLSGHFSILGENGAKLEFSHPDFYYMEVTYKSQKKFIVQMSERMLQHSSITTLTGEQSAENMVQAVGHIGNNQLSTSPSSQLMGRLAGRIAGLNVSFSSGAISGFDNSGLSVGVRGSRATTVLIDGVDRTYTSIDPEQIESITVMKDALSTIMMGHRSSNGVIAITTKKGDMGAPRFSFTAERGFKQANALPDVLPAWQYATLKNEAALNDGNKAIYTADEIAAYKNHSNPYLYPDVDWYDELLNKNASTQRYNFNVQGNGKGFRYFVDLDFMREEGLFKTRSENNFNTNEQMNRFIIRTNVGADITPTTHLQVNLFGRSMRYNEPSEGKAAGSTGTGKGTNGIFTDLLNTPANAYPMLNADGSLGGNKNYGESTNLWGRSTYLGHQFTDVRDITIDVVATQKLDFLLKDLYLRVQGSYNNSTNYLTARPIDKFPVYEYTPNASTLYYKWGDDSGEQTSNGNAISRFRTTYFKGEIGYDHTFGKKHHVTGLFMADHLAYLKFQDKQLPMQYLTLGLRGSYCYDNRYMIEVAGSRGQNSWFAPDERWANYWAAGASWNIHNEAFMEGLSFMSMLKPRITYGLTGQANPTYYGYLQTYTLTNDNRNDWYYFYGETGKGTFENNLASPNLRSEKAKKLNIGLDLGFFNDRLTISGDYFYNKFYDLKATPNFTSVLLGASYSQINYQKIDYFGGELTATWQDHIRNFNYFVSGNFSLSKNKTVYTQEVAKDYPWQIGTGKASNIRYGYVADGLFRSQEEIDACTAVLPSAPKSVLRPGDIRYKDLNNDGVINQDDWGVIGTNKPQGGWGMTIGFSYKGLDFSALLQGTINREVYMNGDFMNGFGNGGKNNAYAYNLNRFTEATAQTATQPRLWLGSNTNNTQVSTFWLKNADFTRLKNIEIGYTLPTKWTRKIYLPSVRIYANGDNLLTFSEIFDVRKDIDPEAWGATYPIMRSFNFGISIKL
ncbi:SusC/RagA family TonB-linked outer membrane protein [Bacteroides xylanisolvens]|uniref:SusC/RagA family TonB-linked outer membrane protein n=4 Tax=Bacteroides TaxID=816 RepID=UPI00319E2DD3